MSSKINSTTKTVLILTVIGCVIPTVYLYIFTEDFLLYYKFPISFRGLPEGYGFLICIVGFIGGLVGIFQRKAYKTDRVICCICTLFCFAFLYANSKVEAPREKARRISCNSNLKQISLALKQYAEDFAGNYPPASGTAGLEILRINDYLTEYAVYTCPSASTVKGKDNQPLTEEIIDYVYIGGLNNKSDPELPLVYDKPKNHSDYSTFGNVLFAGGTVSGFTGNPWTANIKQ